MKVGLRCTKHSWQLTMYAKYRSQLNAVEAREMSLQTDNDSPSSSSLTKQRKDFKSAVAIIPPERIWNPIQMIRKDHDRVYERWMPHINLIYPFLPDDEEGQNFQQAQLQFSQKLRSIKPFRVKFSKLSFGYFRQKKYCTLWLKPLCPNVGDHVADLESIPIAPKREEGESGDHRKEVPEAVKTDVIDSHVPREKRNSVEELQAASQITLVDVESLDGPQLAEVTGGSDDKTLSKRQLKKMNKAKKRQAADMENPNPDRPEIPYHPAVIELQAALESEFPSCNDVSSKSDEGFKPHLSLGQFSRKEIDSYLSKFQETWEDVEFDVTEVHIISRADFHDPFKIRQTVSLGDDID